MEKIKTKDIRESVRRNMRSVTAIRAECAGIKKELDAALDAMSEEEAITREGIRTWMASVKLGSVCDWLSDALVCLGKAAKELEDIENA